MSFLKFRSLILCQTRPRRFKIGKKRELIWVKPGVVNLLIKNQLQHEDHIICSDIPKIKQDSFNKLSESSDPTKRVNAVKRVRPW